MPDKITEIINLSATITDDALTALWDMSMDCEDHGTYEIKLRKQFLRASINATLSALKTICPDAQFAYIWFRTEDGTEYATRHGSIYYKSPEIIMPLEIAQTVQQKLQTTHAHVYLVQFP